MENQNHQPRPENDEHAKQAIAQRVRFLNSLASMFRMELTEDMMQIYMVSLMEVSPELLQKAVVLGVKRWRFFPAVAEILDVVDECRHDPVGHARGYQRLLERYEEHYRQKGIEGNEAPQMKSATEDEMRQLVGDVLSREERVRLGLEAPRQLTPEEQEQRIEKLQKQAQKLLADALTEEGGPNGTGTP